MQTTKKEMRTWRKNAQNEGATLKNRVLDFFTAEIPEDIQTKLTAAGIDYSTPENGWSKSQLDARGIYSMVLHYAPRVVCGDDSQIVCIATKADEKTAFSVPQIVQNVPNINEERKNGLYYYFVNEEQKKRVQITTTDESGNTYTHTITTDEKVIVKRYLFNADRFTYAQVAEILRAAINAKLAAIEEEKKKLQKDAQDAAVAAGVDNTSITDAGCAQADADEAKSETPQKKRTNTRTKASEQIR